MMSWSVYCRFSIRSARKQAAAFSLFICILFATQAKAQITRDTIPDPALVWKKSAIIPGWGQAVNKQGWKIPIIYGALAGVGWYVYNENQQYRNFRAAYYNTHSDDFRFGQTHPNLVNLPAEQLRHYRNSHRNRRDLGVLVFIAAWGLNVVDAYVFANFRDFDVGPDLSFSPVTGGPFLPVQPGLDLKLTFNMNTNARKHNR